MSVSQESVSTKRPKLDRPSSERSGVPTINKLESHNIQRHNSQHSSGNSAHGSNGSASVRSERSNRSNRTMRSMASNIGKRVILVRHGESQAQEVQRKKGRIAGQRERARNQGLRDAALSSRGREQATSLQSDSPDVDVVVVSPLTRALQTACLVFHNTDVPIIVHPYLAEFPRRLWQSGPENKGFDIQQLRQRPELTELPRFSSIDFSVCESESYEHWWHTRLFSLVNIHNEEKKTRQREFLRWLVDRDEMVFCLVGHNNNFMNLTDFNYHLPNSKVQVVPSSEDASPRRRRGGGGSERKRQLTMTEGASAIFPTQEEADMYQKKKLEEGAELLDMVEGEEAEKDPDKKLEEKKLEGDL